MTPTYKQWNDLDNSFLAFCRCWDLEVKRSAKTLTQPALSRVLVRCYGRSFAVAGLFVFLLVGAAGEPGRKNCLELNFNPPSWKALHV